MGDDAVLLKVHPAMFRNRPVFFVLCVLVILAAGVGCIAADKPVVRGLLAAAAGISLVLLLVWWLRTLGSTLIVTEHATILWTGLLSKHTTEVAHRDVRNIIVQQSLLQRVFDAGDLGLSSAGQSDVEIRVDGIPHPDAVKDLINKQRGL